MDKKIHGAAKLSNKVYNEYGGEKKYNNALRKDGAIIALIAIAVSIKICGFIEKNAPLLKTKAERLSEK